MKIRVKLRGADKVRERLKQLWSQYPEAAAAALYQEGLALGALAQDKAPLDEGLLEKSMYVAPPEVVGREVVVEVGFGTQYALVQHERTDFHHPKKGEAKYLEKAGQQRAGGMLERMAKRIVENVKRGLGVRAISPQARTAPEEP